LYRVNRVLENYFNNNVVDNEDNNGARNLGWDTTMNPNSMMGNIYETGEI